MKDARGLGYYRKVAKFVPQHKILEALSLVRLMAREGRIHRTRGAAFVSVLRSLQQRMWYDAGRTCILMGGG